MRIDEQEDASPAFSLNENPAFDRGGEFGSPQGNEAHDGDTLASPTGQAQGEATTTLQHLSIQSRSWVALNLWSGASREECSGRTLCGNAVGSSLPVDGAECRDEVLAAGADRPTPQSEADFRFSHLKRKWHAEEGKFLSSELRRAQDLTVQQEMELETLRQQIASLTSAMPQVDLPAPLHCPLTCFRRFTLLA